MGRVERKNGDSGTNKNRKKLKNRKKKVAPGTAKTSSHESQGGRRDRRKTYNTDTTKLDKAPNPKTKKTEGRAQSGKQNFFGFRTKKSRIPKCGKRGGRWPPTCWLGSKGQTSYNINADFETETKTCPQTQHDGRTVWKKGGDWS